MTVTIRNVPDAIIEKLRDRALRNRRSLEEELLHILTEAAFEIVAEVQARR